MLNEQIPHPRPVRGAAPTPLGRLTAGIYPDLTPAELPRLARDVAFILACVGSLVVMMLLPEAR